MSKKSKMAKLAKQQANVKKEEVKEAPAQGQEKKNAFPDVKQEFYFNLADGRQLKNLLEFGAALENMDDSTFTHHVNESKNDFASWIREVMNENELAESLSAKKGKTEHQMEVLKFMVKRLI